MVTARTNENGTEMTDGVWEWRLEVEWYSVLEREGLENPRKSTLNWRLGHLGSCLPLSLDLSPGSAAFWVTLGTPTPSLSLNCFIHKVGMRTVPDSGRIVPL